MATKQQKDDANLFVRNLSHYGIDRMDRQLVIDAILTEHNTSQQNCVRFAVELLREVSKQTRVDLRNEAGVAFATKFVALIDSGELDGYIPYI